MADLKLMSLTADIVAAYVQRNATGLSELPDLVRSVYEALQSDQGAAPAGEGNTMRRTAAEVRRSVRPDALISFIDGKPYKMLKRHLAVQGHTPRSYRQAYGLPESYPMVCSDYSATRSNFAKATGLGRKPRAKTAKSRRR